MKTFSAPIFPVIAFAVLAVCSFLFIFDVTAQNAPLASGELYDFAVGSSGSAPVPRARYASIVPPEEGGEQGIKVEYAASGKYPGVVFPSPAGGWNLSAYTGVAAEVANVGTARIGITLRVDNEGDLSKKMWNSEAAVLEPGQAKTILVRFGRTFGRPGYELDLEKVTAIHVFANTPSQDGAFIVTSLTAK